MNALWAKEIRLLLPALTAALLLAVAPVWLVPVPGFVLIALCFGTLMLALSSFGREFGLSTFPFLLAQPVTRARIWWTKIAVLAGAMASVFGACFLSLTVRPLDPASHGGFDEMLGPASLVTSALVIFSSGLWTTLLLRQMVAAFWFALLVPASIWVVIFWRDGTAQSAYVLLVLYSIAGMVWAWRQFQRAQEAAWTGGVITLPEWPWFGASSGACGRIYRPLRALLWKEFQLCQVALMGMGGLFLVHLGIVALRNVPGSPTNSFLATALEMFGGIWFIVPLLTGSLNVAEERRFGTMEGLLCLPPSSRVQFSIKLIFVLAISGCLSSLLFWTAESFGATTGAVTELGALICVSIALIAFYASTLTRNMLQALVAAVLAGSALLLAQGLAWRVAAMAGLWEGPLLTLIAVPVVVATLIGLAYSNFRRVSEMRHLWLRNSCGLVSAMLVAATVTTGLYHRAWEFLSPLEPPHGPPQLTISEAPVLHAGYAGSLGVSVLLRDGRLWQDANLHQELPRVIRIGGFSGVISRAKWALQTGNHFIAGSDWIDEAANGWQSVGVRSDGTLWVSEIQASRLLSPDPRENAAMFEALKQRRQQPTQMVKFGDGRDWKRVVHEPGMYSMILLKTDGTMWRWGTRRYKPVLGLASIKPHQLGVESNWTNLTSSDFGIFAWQETGRAWRLVRDNASNQDPKVLLDPELGMERVEGLDNTQWRSLVASYPFLVGVRNDGSLWTFGKPSAEGWTIRATLLQQGVQIGTDNDWASIVRGDPLLVGLKTDGSLWKWDLHSLPHLRGPLTQTPTRLGTHSDWVAIGEFFEGMISLASDGSLWSWSGRAYYDRSQLLAPSRKPASIGNIFNRSSTGGH